MIIDNYINIKYNIYIIKINNILLSTLPIIVFFINIKID